jgi:hypothetical protein
MLDRTIETPAPAPDAAASSGLSEAELKIFETARQVGETVLRRSTFEAWVTLGKAVQSLRNTLRVRSRVDMPAAFAHAGFSASRA